MLLALLAALDWQRKEESLMGWQRAVETLMDWQGEAD